MYQDVRKIFSRTYNIAYAFVFGLNILNTSSEGAVDALTLLSHVSCPGFERPVLYTNSSRVFSRGSLYLHIFSVFCKRCLVTGFGLSYTSLFDALTSVWSMCA